MRRPRGPGGRFLTAEEIKAKEEAEMAQVQEESHDLINDSSFTSSSLVDQLHQIPSTQEDEDQAYDLLNLE